MKKTILLFILSCSNSSNPPELGNGVSGSHNSGDPQHHCKLQAVENGQGCSSCDPNCYSDTPDAYPYIPTCPFGYSPFYLVGAVFDADYDAAIEVYDCIPTE